MPERKRVKSVRKVEASAPQYVYDLAMKDQTKPWFYGNNILVHNSAYFSVYEAFKDQFEKQTSGMTMTRDTAIEMYDRISEQTNETFPEFMDQRFNTGLENGAIIRAGRENLAEYSLFIRKKRYAMNLFDRDGFRQDINGKTGKLKVMGIEIKRSDTPKAIQDALSEGLTIILDGGTPDEMLEYFREFKEEYRNRTPWEMGSPSAANAVTYYSQQWKEYNEGKVSKKPRISGSVMGAIAWNYMCEVFNEDHLERIGDGSKVITCKLKQNDYGFNSISYLTDQSNFPEWFKELPFDTDEMLQSILYKKIENIFGVLGWNLEYIKANAAFDKVFDKVDIDDIDFDDIF